MMCSFSPPFKYQRKPSRSLSLQYHDHIQNPHPAEMNIEHDLNFPHSQCSRGLSRNVIWCAQYFWFRRIPLRCVSFGRGWDTFSKKRKHILYYSLHEGNMLTKSKLFHDAILHKCLAWSRCVGFMDGIGFMDGRVLRIPRPGDSAK